MIRSILLLSFLIFALNPIIGQELACTVDIEAAKTQSTDPKVFQNLEAAITEFMNSRKWTDDEFLPHEKISCSILINIDQELSANEFAGQFIIQSERPVYNSNYKTVVYSYKDDNFKFEYNEFGNLEYSENTFLSNLTSFLAYYAYMVIAYDYESFSPDGGTPYFLKAQDVINSIPSNQKARYEGWSSFGSSRNRAEIVEDVLNPRYKTYRDVIYNFHFNGLDKMSNDLEASRKVITQSLKDLVSINRDNPTSVLLRVFFFAKSDELISLYSSASNSERKEIIDLISNMDPVNANKYQEIGK
ncbi:MAG: DUF4835 family protein [Chitinophagales bacterium]